MPHSFESMQGDCGIITKRAMAGILVLSTAALAGCNTGSMLDLDSGPTAAGPSAGAQVQTAPPMENALALQTDTTNQTTAAPLQAVTTGDRVQFAPVVGATTEAVPALSRRLEARARQSGISIVPESGNPSMVMKGYFSAIADGGKTTVIYVWDVLDPSGNRLHRIQGQQAAPGGQGDGWSSVTNATMEAVADSTISQLSTWLAQRQG
ncbi:hypothetical protein AB2N04_08780 [Nitratireductor sp. GISD-1A_MAKvit]|uniref:hypothetical protein n=1 Tax=Nitratireductor sp. GISD-1A_MAKvit TaxID=3234198 RepID=UPI003465F8C7